jgi:hypothetical protein
MSYGDSDRLSPNDARRFIEDLVRAMQGRSWDEHEKEGTSIEIGTDKPSETKQLYGDVWTLLYGINSGMALMHQEHEEEFDWEAGEKIDHGISGDESWQDHYDQYGYGAYGRGLKIGKRLAFYEDRDFTFSANSESSGTNFNIKAYDDED